MTTDGIQTGRKSRESVTSELTQAGVAAKSVEDFMAGQGYTWENLRSCTITSTTPSFANYVASIPQGTGEGISLSLMAYTNAFIWN